jgi:hypothetical protein
MFTESTRYNILRVNFVMRIKKKKWGGGGEGFRADKSEWKFWK